MDSRVIEFKNAQGTRFNIPLDTTDTDDIKYLHNQICAPGSQVIDYVSWFRKALNQMTQEYYQRDKPVEPLQEKLNVESFQEK